MYPSLHLGAPATHLFLSKALSEWLSKAQLPPPALPSKVILLETDSSISPGALSWGAVIPEEAQRCQLSSWTGTAVGLLVDGSLSDEGAVSAASCAGVDWISMAAPLPSAPM